MSNQAKIWYFAYGSNLNVDQMKSRIGLWQLSKRAVARNYKLVFNVYSKKLNGYMVNMQESENFEDTVPGVVYHLTLDQLNKLQKFEGIEPVDIRVELEDGNEISHAKVFIWKTTEKEHEPPNDYKRVIEQGLLQHGYPESRARKIFSRFEKVHPIK
ncbi:MAG: gamma-glutamylcyclotransferase [Thaumarchaeota archaeon]|nr:gamma-glutamylcyclotransferase [Nitrososphaerota archaeon]